MHTAEHSLPLPPVAAGGPSGLWGRVTLLMLSSENLLTLSFKKPKQNRERKSKPSPLYFLFHLFFGYQPPVQPQEVSVP